MFANSERSSCVGSDMKSTITLTEAELKKAILEYVENNTTAIQEVDHSDIEVDLHVKAREEGGLITEEFSATLAFNEELDTTP